MVFEENKENMDEEALGYLGVNLTFKELKEKVDQFADSLIKSGLKPNDVVLMGVSNSPEAIVSLLAINKIGLCNSFFDIK